MSKRNFFFGNASGKIGELVMYRAGGEQRARTYVAKIKNPKTAAQAKNRISMLNLATTYRLYRPILAESFPTRPTNQSGYNAFVSANKNPNTPAILSENAQAGLIVPYGMTMAKGNLVQFGRVGGIAIGSKVSVGLNVTPFVTSELAALISSGSSVVFDTIEKLNTLRQALGLPQNVVFSVLRADYADEGFEPSYGRSIIAEGLIPLAEHRLVLRKESNDYFLTINAIDDSEVMGTFIISYRDGNGVLQVTNSVMDIADADKSMAEQWMPGGEVYEQLLALFTASSSTLSADSVTASNSGSGSGGSGGGSNGGGSGSGGGTTPPAGGGNDDDDNTNDDGGADFD